MKCADDFVSGSTGVFAACAKKGLAAGFKKFWKLSDDKKALKAYKKNREAIKNSKKNMSKYYATVAQAVKDE